MWWSGAIGGHGFEGSCSRMVSQGEVGGQLGTGHEVRDLSGDLSAYVGWVCNKVCGSCDASIAGMNVSMDTNDDSEVGARHSPPVSGFAQSNARQPSIDQPFLLS